MYRHVTSLATSASAAKSQSKSAIFSKWEDFIVHGTFVACVAASVKYHLTVKRLASTADEISTAALTTSGTGRFLHNLGTVILWRWMIVADFINTLFIKKVHVIYVITFPTNWKPLQIIFGVNIDEVIWNKVTHGNFDTYLPCVKNLHHQMASIK